MAIPLCVPGCVVIGPPIIRACSPLLLVTWVRRLVLSVCRRSCPVEDIRIRERCISGGTLRQRRTSGRALSPFSGRGFGSRSLFARWIGVAMLLAEVRRLPCNQIFGRVSAANAGTLLSADSVVQADIRTLPLLMRLMGPPVEGVPFVGRMLSRHLGSDLP